MKKVLSILLFATSFLLGGEKYTFEPSMILEPARVPVHLILSSRDEICKFHEEKYLKNHNNQEDEAFLKARQSVERKKKELDNCLAEARRERQKDRRLFGGMWSIEKSYAITCDRCLSIFRGEAIKIWDDTK